MTRLLDVYFRETKAGVLGRLDDGMLTSIRLARDHTPDLAPIYDVVCTAVYPRLSKMLAMKIGGRDVPDTIQLKHWMTLVPDTKAAQRILVRDLAHMAEGIVHEADALVAELADEGIKHLILSAIRKVISSRAGSLQRVTEQVS